jgi:chlorobactene glucosyltransferase
MLILFIYQAIMTAILAALFLNTVNNLRLLRQPRLPAPEGPGGQLVSLLVPARNEARSIAACVEALARQDYGSCEILVLDDQSDDATAAIVTELAGRYANVRLLHGRPLPADWHGKAFACAQLAEAAAGSWLLFVDADTELAPECVRVALAQAEERRADLLTMMPRILAESLGEALLLPIIPLTFVAFLPLGLVSDHSSPLFAGALGPFLLFRRDAYVAVGGHASVRTDIVEDMQLSRLVKRCGGRVVWIDGTTLMSVRLYHGFREAWRGLSKSAFAAIDYSLPGLILGVPLCIALFFGPYFFLVGGLITRSSSSAWLMFWLPLLQLALLWASQLLLTRRFHLPPVTLLLQAATILGIFGTTFHSALQTKLGKGVEWKGRTYHFDALHRNRGTRVNWANGLVTARLLAAALLALSGWLKGPLGQAGALVLLGWTAAVLENLLRKHVSRWEVTADLAAGFACLAYLQQTRQLSLWLVLLCLLATVIGARWSTVQVTAGTASVLLGIILLITAQVNAPNRLLLGWTALLALAVARSVAQTVIPWLQRLRSF